MARRAAQDQQCDGGVVRLDGYHGQHANTVDVLGARHRVTLLVVEPEASAETAHAALMAAGHRGNTDDVQTLLRSGPLPAEVPGGRPSSQRRRSRSSRYTNSTKSFA